MNGINFERIVNQMEDHSIRHIKCELCNLIPMQLEICSNCKEIYCRKCIEGYSTCPLCKKEYVGTSPMRNIISMLRDVIIYCKFSGCNQKVSYKDLEYHEQIECELRSKQCEGCDKEVVESKLNDHIKECSGFVYTCENCDFTCKRNENNNHSCFKYFEVIFTEKMKLAIGNQLAVNKLETEGKINELKCYFDFLKGEVSRLDEEMKNLRLRYHVSIKNRISLEEETLASSQQKVTLEINNLSRSLSMISMEELNTNAYEMRVCNTGKDDNIKLTDLSLDKPSLTEVANLDQNDENNKYSEVSLKSITRYSSGIYFHQVIDDEFNFQENTNIFTSEILSKSTNLEIIKSLSSEETVPNIIDEQIKCIAYMDSKLPNDSRQSAESSDSTSSAESDYIITGHIQGSIVIWSVVEKEMKVFKLYKEHSKAVTEIKQMPQFKGIFASCGLDKLIKIFDMKSAASLKTIQCDCAVYCIEPMPEFNKSYLASGGSNKNLIVWDIKNKNKVMSREIEKRQEPDKLLFLSKVKVNGKSNLILCVNYDTIRLINLNTMHTEREFIAHVDWINSISYIKDDRFVTSSSDGTIKLWSVFKEHPLNTISVASGSLGGLFTLPDQESVFVSASNDRKMNVIDTDNDEMKVLKFFELKNEVDKMVLVPLNMIASFNNNKINLFKP